MTVGATTNEVITSILPNASALGPSGAKVAAVLDSTVDAATATASSTQANTPAVTARFNRFTVVAAASGTRLPPALPGMTVVVYNGQAVNALLVWPASATQGGITGGDAINAGGANASYSLAASNSATFRCITAGQWYASQGALS
jgi:hypothetical protein